MSASAPTTTVRRSPFELADPRPCSPEAERAALATGAVLARLDWFLNYSICSLGAMTPEERRLLTEAVEILQKATDLLEEGSNL